MPLNKVQSNSNMFESVGWTWNPLFGCTHNCKYKCWAKGMAKRMKRLDEWLSPRIIYSKLIEKLPDDGSWIFLGSMSDLFCYAFNNYQIREVLDRLADYEGSCKFLLQTKNPVHAISFLSELKKLKDKLVMGTTWETTLDLKLSNAPLPIERYASMVFFKTLGFKTFLSLEPLTQFNLDKMVEWITRVQPEVVEIGLENRGNVLVKPPEGKIKLLLHELKKNNIKYNLKKNLKHLEKGK